MTPRLRDIFLLLACRPDRLAAIAWWRICGKRLRARNRLQSAIAALPFAHQRMMAACGREDLAALSDSRKTGHSATSTAPAICVHLHITAGAQITDTKRAVASVQRQSVAPLKLIVTTEGTPVSLPAMEAMEIAPGAFGGQIDGLHAALTIAESMGADYLVPLAANSLLPPHALAAYTADGLRKPTSANALPILYGDQDEIGHFGLGAAPWLKPEWDARMILSQDYASAACALPVSSTLQNLKGQNSPAASSIYEIILRLARGERQIPVRHIARITGRTAAGQWQDDSPSRLDAITRAIGPKAVVEAGSFGTMHVQWTLPEPAPKVSIVVATRDRVELLRTCIDGLLHATDYPDFEVIIADNDSREAETLAYMDAASADPRVRVVRWPHPFNYSAINNFAASFATGRFVCLLNNDIEILEPDWLAELVREAARPGTGAVGARLLYPDRSIQHAGVAIGLGNAAGHAHRALPDGEPGYFAQALIARGASAVTGACLLVEKAHFDAVGGLDEKELAVAYNDVDLCLKLQELGLTNIYTPAATLIHHESKSRGLDFAPEHLERYLRELAVFQERWGTTRVVDPWHHPQLDRTNEVYAPAH